MSARLKTPKPCGRCGDEFRPFTKTAKFCSQRCANTHPIPSSRLAPIINRVLPEYGGDVDDRENPNPFNTDQAGPLDSMACEIARTTGRHIESVLRRLRRIRNGEGGMTFAFAEDILSGIGLPHLWHTELADLYEAAA